MASPNGPTTKQLKYLRRLAQQTGTTFTPPRTIAQASAEIERLKATASTGFTFTEAADKLDGNSRSGLASSVQPWETTGYGSAATWSERA